MDCENPTPSFLGLFRAAALYASGCGGVQIEEAAELDPIDCDTAGLSDLTLLSMTMNAGVNAFRVVVTEVTEADLCEDYALRIDCDGLSAEQAFREAVTVDGDTATIRVLKVTDITGDCLACAGIEQDTMSMVAGSIVTDGTDTYILAIDPEEEVTDALDCDTADVDTQTLVRSALAYVTTCGMWAWRIGAVVIAGGDFNGDFNDDFNI